MAARFLGLPIISALLALAVLTALRSTWAGVTGNVAPRGYFDAVTNGVAVGWAVDDNSPADSVKVHVYADGKFLAETRADKPRPDVNGALGITGSHGFSFTLPASAKGSLIEAYALDAQGDGNRSGRLLHAFHANGTSVCAGKGTNVAPQGQFAGVSGGIARGSAFDINCPYDSAYVHFYTGDGRYIGAAIANEPSPSVNRSYGVPGDHGFTFTLPQQYRGTSVVYAYAVDDKWDPSKTKRLAMNVVVLMVDDLDQRLFDTLLRARLMPNLERYLLAEGVNFTESFSSNSICCPSRATYVTGQYSHNHGVRAVINADGTDGILSFVGAGSRYGGVQNTLATWLRSTGYRTGHVGKYLNGYGKSTPTTWIPPGYDEWHGLVDPYTYSMYEFMINDNGRTYTSQAEPYEYQTDFLAARAAGVIDRSAAHFGSQPFFLTVTPVAPHIENDYENYSTTSSRFADSIRPAPRHRYLADGVTTNGAAPSLAFKSSVFESDLSDKLGRIGSTPALTAEELALLQKQWKDRLASMIAVDEMIGTLVRTLMKNGQWNETVFIFTSDNGWFYGEHKLTGKSWAYEESIRIPLVIRSPWHGARGPSPKLVLNNDLAPTIAELAAVVPARPVDGRSLLPLLDDAASPAWARKRVFIESFQAGMSPTGAPPTYAAIRESYGASHYLYAFYFSALESFTGSSLGAELYDLNWDKTQEWGLPVTPAQAQALNTRISYFVNCSGPSCHSVENSP